QGMTTNLGLKGIDVSASVDGVNWMVIGTGDPNNDLAWQRFSLDAPVNAKFVKIDMERADTFDGWARVLEVQVWGSPIEACDHNYVAVMTAPTCTEKGYTTYTCSKCGDSYRGDEVAALGHDFGEWAVTKEATCAASGEEARTCTRCGEKETKAIDALGHDYKAVVTAPTCTEAGFTTYTCARCNDSYVGDEVAKLGHDFVEGVCTRCGAADPDYVPPVSYDALNAAIAAAEAVDKDKYTEDSVAAFEAALAAAKEALKADKQEAVDKAKADLDAAKAALVEKPAPFRFDDVQDESQYYFDPVYWAVEQGITTGTTPTTFSPNSGCTRAQVVTFLWRAAGKPEPTSTNNPFEDVPADQYYYKAVLWAVEKGITTGTSPTTFRPDRTCTRAQIVTFLWRYKGQPEPTTTENPFVDVPADQYYYKAVLWAVENGVTTGTSATKFSPDSTCTRAQIVTFLYRAQPKEAT
ncbi:MAG: S-layer homology domain-containing protein, partial [Oscillospiraceae bacterium]|nr:S-layer homology domain-containing protein [Oscillospiraceae bacterium]